MLFPSHLSQSSWPAPLGTWQCQCCVCRMLWDFTALSDHWAVSPSSTILIFSDHVLSQLSGQDAVFVCLEYKVNFALC